MFKEKTVFVLGAGASKEATGEKSIKNGLPTGEELKDKIRKKLDFKIVDAFGNIGGGDHDIMQILKEENNLVNSARDLCIGLQKVTSIDNLLNIHQDNQIFQRLGKLSIASIILEGEKESDIYVDPMHYYDDGYSVIKSGMDHKKTEKSWFARFFEILSENVKPEKLEKIFDNISIISFNYDRCIEHYLHNSLIALYQGIKRENTELIDSAMKSLKIFHPYGSLGKLQNCRFGSEKNNLSVIADQIRTFNEELKNEEEIQEIRNTIQEAKTIVFLGFAFHKQNLELIKPDKSSSVKNIYATAYGMDEEVHNDIKSKIKEILQQEENQASIKICNIKCSGLFDKFKMSLKN